MTPESSPGLEIQVIGPAWAVMPDLGDKVSYQQKMRERIARAEELDDLVQVWEKETTAQVREEYANDLAAYEPGAPRRQRELFLIEDALKSNRIFKNRVNSRNNALNWAQTYALAALVEEITHSGAPSQLLGRP